MTTAYDKTYPNPLDPPRNDVQTMQNNALAIYNIWDKDHFTFDASSPGLHKQVTFPVNSTPTNPSPPSAILYTQLGSATGAPTNSDLVLKNTNSSLVFPVSMVRAFGTWQSGSFTNKFNVAAGGGQSGGTITVNLTSGCVTGTSYIVIMATTVGTTGGGAKDQITTTYSIGGGGLQIQFKSVDVSRDAVTDVASLSFIVLQA